MTEIPSSGTERLAFGPVPSRRLGRSVGINNIPAKVCTYACTYCQVGRTSRLRTNRSAFFDPAILVAQAAARAEAAERAGETVDYLTIVPDGEPTLDQNLGRLVVDLKALGLPVAVITNGSLLDRADVRDDLMEADWVSAKVDAADAAVWHRVNRPHGGLRFEAILEGLSRFAGEYGGTLTTETILLDAVNDDERHVRSVARLVAGLAPSTAYIAVPTRPPAEPSVRPAAERAVTRAYELFRTLHEPVELLTGYEGDAFAATGNPRDDLLSIAAVHPLRESAVRRILDGTGAPWSVVSDLVKHGALVEVNWNDRRYFVRPSCRETGARDREPGEDAGDS
jgi:wyosine [tRNA(Phe)-imidazoG37] synthetase (radical SAM superfamily)